MNRQFAHLISAIEVAEIEGEASLALSSLVEVEAVEAVIRFAGFECKTKQMFSELLITISQKAQTR
jgi:hypothetical protein